jgi:MbtH protein
VNDADARDRSVTIHLVVESNRSAPSGAELNLGCPAILLVDFGEPEMAGKDGAVEPMYSVIVNEENQFVVWPDGRYIPSGWRHVGRTGTNAELSAYLREMFVETLPAPMLIREVKPLESRWG